MKKAVLVVMLLLIGTSSYGAGHIGQVTIKKIRLMDGRAMVEIDGTIDNKAACATVDNWVSVPLDESHAANRRLSILLSAQAQKKYFNPVCSDTCDETWVSWLGKVTICNEVSIE